MAPHTVGSLKCIAIHEFDTNLGYNVRLSSKNKKKMKHASIINTTSTMAPISDYRGHD